MRATGRFPTAIFGQSEELEPGERLTLIMLYAMAESDDLVAWTSPREMSDESGYTIRAMQKHMQRLIEHDFVTVVTRPDPRSRANFKGYGLAIGLDGERRQFAGGELEA